jgi:trehalose synthase
VYRELEERAEHDDVRPVTSLPDAGSNVLRKSFREGPALTVSEALWRGTPVVGANGGGIRL